MVKSQNASAVNTSIGWRASFQEHDDFGGQFAADRFVRQRRHAGAPTAMLAGKHGQRFGELVGGTELDHLGAGGDARHVARSGNIRIPSSIRLRAIGIAQAQLAAHDETPVRALAAVVGQALEDRRAVRSHVVTFEDDGKVVEFDVATAEHLIFHYNRSFCLTGPRHRNIPAFLGVTR